MTEPVSLPDEQRWQRESEYFDAQEYSSELISNEVLERYVKCQRPYLLAEYLFWRLGDVRGKRVLEIGCGDGTNALILALKGATVVGIDLSQRAVATAERRAARHALGDRARFVCGPIERSLRDEAKFDVIAGFAVLHHLLPSLHDLLSEMKRHGHSQTEYIFQEPVNLSPLLRRLRLAMPVSVSGTPDERPLERSDLALITRHFRDVEIKHFHGLSRFAARFLLGNGAYEGRAWWRKAGYCSSSRADRLLFDRLNLKALSSCAVIYARG
ncbi:MAG: class I SAM-dependent methyltransferase [Bryobacteraceae bacterium]